MTMSTTMHERLDRTREPNGAARNSARALDVPIDWAHLSRFTLGDRSLEREVLGLFAGEAPRYLSLLLATTSRKSWIEAAHTLKGSARAVGAWAVAECAQAVETLEISARGELAEKRMNRTMEQALDRLVDSVRKTLAYIENLDNNGPDKQPA
jgi:HPt (histidine-containing phosphotransfer) domain-containing protein